MNTLQSLRLVYEIYFKKGLPNLEVIQSYGLLAVKIGQIHALRLDFLPAEKCQELTKLYRKNKPIPAEEMRQLMITQGGQAFLSNFKNIDPHPLATASVGQIYRAQMQDGREVVIKVIKSRLKEKFFTDVARFKNFFTLVLRLYPKLSKVGNPLGIIEDIETYTTAELDLTNEIRGTALLKKLYDNYRGTMQLPSLKFISSQVELSNQNILVSDFIQAPSVDELLSQGKFSYQDMLKLFQLQGFYMFVAGQFHGDIHPGNVMFDGKDFYFLDTAYIGTASDKIRKNLFGFFSSLVEYNYDGCAEYIIRMSTSPVAPEVAAWFKTKFLELYKDFKGKNVSELSLTKQMMLTIKLAVNHGMIFEKGIFPIIRSLMYMDGMVLKSNPKAILMEDMKGLVNVYQKYI